MSKLIIFDMDGTVVNSGPMIAKTINAVRHDLGLYPLDEKPTLEVLNDPDINSARYFYGTESFTDRQIALFEHYYDRYCLHELTLYAGMADLLAKHSRDFTLTIATNAHTRFANKILSHLQVAAHFDFVIGADMVQTPKPHPQMLHDTMERFGLPKDKTLLIGDSHKDRRAAQAAGIAHALVGWGFSDHTDTAALITDYNALDTLIQTF
ncbi:MAG: HAD family hydrolase [Campylobacterota bacterium]